MSLSATGSIKKEARDQLSNKNWGKAIAIALMLLLLSGIGGKTGTWLADGLINFNLNFNVDNRLIANPVISGLMPHIAHWFSDVLLFIISLFLVFPLSIGVIKSPIDNCFIEISKDFIGRIKKIIILLNKIIVINISSIKKVISRIFNLLIEDIIFMFRLVFDCNSKANGLINIVFIV